MTKAPTIWLRYALFIGAFPLMLGLVLDLVLQGNIFSNPLLRGQIAVDLGTLLLLSSLMLSGIAWTASFLSWYWLRRGAQALAEETKRQAEEYRRFIHRLDHEMKTPLAVLRIGLTSLDQQCWQSDQERQAVHSATARLHRLIQDLRKLADLETCSLEQKPIDLAELLQETILAVQNARGQSERSISLNISRIPWPPAPVKGDWDLLTLAFYNLLDNACKFTHPSAPIEVWIREDSVTVTVDVADNGPGIAEADLPHLFEELYRGRNARNIEGNGLGLAVVKKIIERHGGRVTVRSRLGQGTVFTVQLPLL